MKSSRLNKQYKLRQAFKPVFDTLLRIVLNLCDCIRETNNLVMQYDLIDFNSA